jgi:hypothetical protein
MNRTFGALLITLILGFLVTPLAGEAQQATKVHRIRISYCGQLPRWARSKIA